MIRKVICIILLLFSINSVAQQTSIYLIPGQGSDARIFKNLQLDASYIVKHIKYVVPEKDQNMHGFARELAKQIDTSQTFILIGVSLGGMIATEMNDFLNPQRTIIISSAKMKSELPYRYTFQKYVPLYKLFSSRFIKKGALFMQPIVEPDREKEEETFEQMLKDKDPIFLKRTIQIIMNWDREVYNSDIIHIHGDNDNTIPIRNVKYDYLVENGSHMMVLTRPKEMNEILKKLL